jgi:1-deoxy-D-xylulose-5-phosphate reductoisomerase
MTSLAILGSTGSIGRQTLEVVKSLSDRFRIVALAAGNNVEQLAAQIGRHRPELVSVSDARRAAELRDLLRTMMIDPLPEVVWGREGLLRVATHPDAEIVVSAAVGVVGLAATYAAVQAGKRVALSNKEVLVVAGEIFMAAAKTAGIELLPIDSEHNAIHQCLKAGGHDEVRRIILTASGGPFRKTPLAQMANASPDEALAHPKWRMGKRISIDSATLVNKGFELIEARWLFDISPDQIEIVIHPQSTIHSMVEYVDGSILAQLGPTDMRMPIQYALTYPERVASNGVTLDWAALRRLDFEPVSTRRFPCLRLAREALRQGGAQPCALNAADEVAVAAFLAEQMPFSGIARVIETVLERMPQIALLSIDDVAAADAEARRLAQEEVARQNDRVSA